MKSTLFPFAACAVMLAPCCADAATTLVSSKLVNTVIPDNNSSGLASIIAIAGSGQTVDSVDVSIDVRNGWNGDMYAYLEHNGVISVLLNRPGRTADNPAGAASSGMQVTFTNSALADIHSAISGNLGANASGIYQPDGRSADPGLVTDASPRSLYLSGFSGQAADGAWTLFVADLAGGDVATLNSWSLSISVVPEPSSALLVCAALPLLLRRRRR